VRRSDGGYGQGPRLGGRRIPDRYSLNVDSRRSEDVVGNTFPIQSSHGSVPGPRLTNLSYSQSLFDDQLNVRIGRQSIDFNAIPFATFYNAPGAFGYPATAWGARTRYTPPGDFDVMAGIYNGDPEVGLASRHGLDFTLQGPALPGNVKLGGFVLGGTVPGLRHHQLPRRSPWPLPGGGSRPGRESDAGSRAASPDERAHPRALLRAPAVTGPDTAAWRSGSRPIACVRPDCRRAIRLTSSLVLMAA